MTPNTGLPPKNEFEELGIFKLKDKEGRNGILIDFSKAKKPVTEMVAMHIIKISGANNKVKILVEWKGKKKECKKPVFDLIRTTAETLHNVFKKNYLES